MYHTSLSNTTKIIKLHICDVSVIFFFQSLAKTLFICDRRILKNDEYFPI